MVEGRVRAANLSHCIVQQNWLTQILLLSFHSNTGPSVNGQNTVQSVSRLRILADHSQEGIILHCLSSAVLYRSSKLQNMFIYLPINNCLPAGTNSTHKDFLCAYFIFHVGFIYFCSHVNKIIYVKVKAKGT